MCVSSPARNVTVRRGKPRRHHQHHHSERGDKPRHHQHHHSKRKHRRIETVDQHVDDDDDDDDESYPSLLLGPTASLSGDDGEEDESILGDGMEEKPSPAKGRITDVHDILACRQATRGLQSELPQCSPGSSESESQAASSEVKPMALFHSPQSDEHNNTKASRQGRLFSAFAILGSILAMLEAASVCGYFSANEATIIDHAFLAFTVSHHISSAKAAAFTYANMKVTTKRSRRSFDPADSRKNSHQWSLERLHIFLSFLFFRMILLLPLFNETSSGANAMRSIAEMTFIRANSMLSVQIKKVIALVKRYISKEIVALALTNPLKLHFRLRQLATYIRWAKFLTPLIGTLNKFKGHCIDLHRKWSQRRRSRRANQLWNSTLSRMRQQRRYEAAILRIQRNFRTRRESKTEKRMNLMKDRRSKTKSAKKIHLRLRRQASQARLGIAKIDLVHAENSKRRMISESDVLQMTLHRRGKRDRRTFLLRPDTNFAVLWKCVTVLTVLLEVFSLSLAPKMTGELRKLDRKEFAEMCAASLQSNDPDTTRRFWGLVAVQLAQFLANVVPIVSFASVFIEFYIGELSSESGLVVPKPFFSRWIVPGVLLQLLVNPSMKDTSRNVWAVVSAAKSIGFARVASLLCIAYPMLIMVWDAAVGSLHWFIEIQNR